MKARQRPGGLVAQRISLSMVNASGAGSILRTFAASFEEMLLFQISPEDLLLIGSSAPLRLDDRRIRRQIAARDAVVGDLSRALSVGPNDLLMALRLGGEALRDLGTRLGAEAVIVDGADHFLRGGLERLHEAIGTHFGPLENRG